MIGAPLGRAASVIRLSRVYLGSGPGFFSANTVRHSFLIRTSPMIPITTSMRSHKAVTVCVSMGSSFLEAAQA